MMQRDNQKCAQPLINTMHRTEKEDKRKKETHSTQTKKKEKEKEKQCFYLVPFKM